MKLITQRNQGFAWHYCNGVRAKGYLFDGVGTFHREEAVANYFATATDRDSFHKKLRDANGCFAIIRETDTHVLAGVDRVRSIPLFYAVKDGDLILGDDFVAIQNELGGEEIDPVAREEFLRVAYTVGPTTLDPRVRQIEAGEWFAYNKTDKQRRIECYYRHSHGHYRDESEGVLLDELDEVTRRWTWRLIESAEGRTIVVPLSGGYDSRLIVCALKREGYQKVLCYSYGVPNSYEHQIAKKVASQLGYPIHVVHYSREQWKAAINSPRFTEFCRFTSQRCAVSHLQDLPACEMLESRKLIPADSIVTPGYCGDLQGGSYVPAEVGDGHPEKPLAVGIDEYLYRRLFVHLASSAAPEMKQAIIHRINGYTAQFKTEDIESFCSVLEDWFTRHKVAKFVVNSLRTYEWFGHEWRLPLWDNEWIEWWYRIPLKMRVNSTLYHRYLFERLFQPFAVQFSKPKPLFEMQWLLKKGIPSAIIPLARRMYIISRKLLRSKCADVDGFDNLSQLLLEQLLPRPKPREFGNINGVIATWSIAKKL